MRDKLTKRKDVTVKNMLRLHKIDKRNKHITWDNFFLITGWKTIKRT